MGLFSKFRKKSDVIDLGKLQRKGIITLKESAKETSLEKDSNGYVHLKSSSASPTEKTGESALGFLGSLANINSNTSIQENNADLSFMNEKERRKERIRKKFEEIENRIESTSNRITDILQRIELLEKKIERLERKNVY